MKKFKQFVDELRRIRKDAEWHQRTAHHPLPPAH